MPGVHLTYYDVLGVPMSATRAEIQKAYKDQLVQSHPGVQSRDNDSTPYDPQLRADKQRVAWLTRAHDVLGNDVLRRIYDAYLWTSGVRLTPDLHPPLAAARLRDGDGDNARSNDDDNSSNQQDDDGGDKRKRKDDAACAPATASRDGDDGVVSRVHVDPATNARYEYTRSADGAVRRYAYYYDSAKDPSRTRRDDNNNDNDDDGGKGADECKARACDTKRDTDDSDERGTTDRNATAPPPSCGSDKDAATMTQTVAAAADEDKTSADATTMPPLLPRRARVIEEQIHSAGHPLYSLCSVPLVGGVSLGDATIYVLVP